MGQGPERLRVECAEARRVLRLTLDHPPENRITPGMLRGIAGALDRLEADDGPDVLVLAGSGRSFSKGFDEQVIDAAARSRTQRASLVAWNDVYSRLAASRKLTIAAIHGACLGGGLELALACQLRFCSERARLGLPELALGLLPGLGGIHRLVRLVGRSKALELLVGGDLVSAAEALRIGLVNRVVPQDGLAPAVQAFVRSVLSVERRRVWEAIELTALAERRGDGECLTATLEAILGDRIRY